MGVRTGALENSQGGGSGEGRHPEEQAVEEHSECEQIRSPVDLTSENLLRCHGACGAENVAIARQALDSSLVQSLRQTKVENLHLSRVRDHHVAQLQVAVNDARSVRRSQAQRDPGADPHDPVHVGEGPGLPMIEGSTVDEFHDEPCVVFQLDPIVDLHDGRVAQLGQRARLQPQPGLGSRVGRALEHSFQSDSASQSVVERAPDLAHSSTSETPFDAVGTDPRGDVMVRTGECAGPF